MTSVAQAFRAATRWTPFVFLFPRRYVERGTFWESFDLDAWAGGYEWEEDEWNGYLDAAERPRETVDSERGDCEDYALVAASWALARGRRPVGLGFCFKGLVPRHAIAYDGERVYSSGRNTEETPEEYLAGSEYTRMIKRRIA